MKPKKRWQVKQEVDINDITMIHTNLMILLTAFIIYCENHGKNATITSMIHDEVEGRISRTHSEGRAFDASVRGWTRTQIEKLVMVFNSRFKEIAAISASDGVPRAVVHHKTDKGAYHLHFQVRP